MPEELSILHVDMDAFFASIEVLDDPSLAGKPLLVGGDGKRGVVATASYEARKFGCHSAQPMSVAKRLCPAAIAVPPRGSRYREVSVQLFQIFERCTPLVEPLSIDEAFLDVHGTERLFGPPVEVAKKLKEDINRELSLTASVGVAPNMFIAKLASDLEKPDGLTVLSLGAYMDRSKELSIAKIWGLGPASAKKFEKVGVRTVADLRALPLTWLEKNFGSSGEHFYRLARGQDSRRVTPDHEAKSVGQEQTFGEDLANPAEVRGILLGQVENVARRLRKHDLLAGTVTVKIRYGDFKTITRRTKLIEPSYSTRSLWDVAKRLFDEWAESGFQPVRLIGAATSDFATGPLQSTLIRRSDEEGVARVDSATDAIVERFGRDAIRRGGVMGRE
jgi:DNA polymerase-4